MAVRAGEQASGVIFAIHRDCLILVLGVRNSIQRAEMPRETGEIAFGNSESYSKASTTAARGQLGPAPMSGTRARDSGRENRKSSRTGTVRVGSDQPSERTRRALEEARSKERDVSSSAQLMRSLPEYRPGINNTNILQSPSEGNR